MDTRRADPICSLTPQLVPAGHVCPLFWQHGEDPDVLRGEMRAMRSVGIRQCILESRPHPDWLGPGWWRSLDAIFEEADRLGMRIWVFDDGAYPSGRAGTLIRDRHPELLKVYLACRVIEAHGPLPGAAFFVGAWIGKDESLVAVVAGRRRDPRGDGLDPGTLADLTGRAASGTLRWDVPEGAWRVFVLVRTREGGEEWTKDHLNPLVLEAGQAFIQEVHERHYARYGARFGTTFAGFFTDEPRFGNKPAYDAMLGDPGMVLPWCDDLPAELEERWQRAAPAGAAGGGFRRVLPTLWYDAGELAHRARVLYMDVVSARFGRAFTVAIGEWCRARDVRLIGHVVEDNSAHARLGYGAGHFFRALRGQHMSGVDIVFQVWPGIPEGRIITPFGTWDLDFFRWGLAKLASSDAHADPRKAGRAMCEIFGAYGWQLGLRDMKWLTDFACVRGINFLVPHAFSPKFPDPDCPPHFHAQGNNPQWRLFGLWSSYAERLCHLLSDGDHRADAAVLYHAEAEWAGPCERFEASVAALAARQIDCDVVCIDTLLDPALTKVEQGELTVNRESFHLLVVPYAERLPARFFSFLVHVLSARIPILFTEGFPTGASDEDIPPAALAALRASPNARAVPITRLAEEAARAGRVRARPEQPHLRTYRYSRPGMDLVFCFNEDTRVPVACRLSLVDARDPLGYEALADAIVAVEHERSGSEVSVRIRLEPYGSLFLVFADDPTVLGSIGSVPPDSFRQLAAVDGPWRVSTSDALEWPRIEPRPRLTGPGDVALAEGFADFAGTVVYETEIAVPGGRSWLDLGRVGEASEAWLDGEFLGARICPPHRFALPPGGAGRRALRIAVTTTLGRRLGNNAFDRAMPHEPVGLLGPVRILGPGR
jgi:hypothetical protein